MMSLGQIAGWLPEGQLIGDSSLALLRVHTDSRSLRTGDLFVALEGERFDAHDFLPQAKAQGAVAAIAQRGLADAGLHGVEVPDSRHALGLLAAAWRRQFELPLIAVTGSNGKTTVTQMIASIQRAAAPGAALATEGNFNNDIGVPLTLLRLLPEHRLAVVELGMNHPGEIALLADIARPTVALVNNAQREHMEFMASVEAVARENGAVIGALPADGIAVYPQGDAFTALWRRLAGSRASLTFGVAGSGASVELRSVDWRQTFWQVSATTSHGELSYRLSIAGRHNVQNSLAAIACAIGAGVELPAIAEGLTAFQPVKGRSVALSVDVAGRNLTLIDDTYNANPDSVRAAIEVLAGQPAPRLLVLGDMGEVGNQGPVFHAEVGALARERGIELLFTLGAQAANTANAFGTGRHFDDIAALCEAVEAQLPKVGSVLVKGSRFMAMERVVASIAAASAPATTPAQREAHAS
ncbi:MAG: UDP-N-acetylmuramoyl-tripeptide--D-alanyl-D-alanine ligase [Burkholderiales bacterium]